MTMDMLCVGEQAFSVWRYLMKSEHTQQRVALKITVPSRILIRESTGCTHIRRAPGPSFRPRRTIFITTPPLRGWWGWKIASISGMPQI